MTTSFKIEALLAQTSNFQAVVHFTPEILKHVHQLNANSLLFFVHGLR